MTDGQTDRQMDRQTFAILESLSGLKNRQVFSHISFTGLQPGVWVLVSMSLLLMVALIIYSAVHFLHQRNKNIKHTTL